MRSKYYNTTENFLLCMTITFIIVNIFCYVLPVFLLMFCIFDTFLRKLLLSGIAIIFSCENLNIIFLSYLAFLRTDSSLKTSFYPLPNWWWKLSKFIAIYNRIYIRFWMNQECVPWVVRKIQRYSVVKYCKKSFFSNHYQKQWKINPFSFSALLLWQIVYVSSFQSIRCLLENYPTFSL